MHAKFIKDNSCPTQLAKANYVVGTWAKIHGTFIHLLWHLLIAGCDIGVQFSVCP